MSSACTLLDLPINSPTIRSFSSLLKLGLPGLGALKMTFLSLFLGGFSKSYMLTSYTIFLSNSGCILNAINPFCLLAITSAIPMNSSWSS